MLANNTNQYIGGQWNGTSHAIAIEELKITKPLVDEIEMEMSNSSLRKKVDDATLETIGRFE